MAEQAPPNLVISSVVSGRTRKPYVQLQWGEERGQLTPAEAVEHATKIIRAAESALSDAFLVNFFSEKLDIAPELALGVLADFRRYREVREMEDLTHG